MRRLTTPARALIQAAGRWYCRETCKREFKNQKLVKLNERPVEYAFVFQQIARLAPRTILDVGTGTTALPHLMRKCGPVVTAIDNIQDYWQRGMFNRHFHVINDDITRAQITGQFDLITCISVLEHIERYDDAVRNMMSLLSKEGHLVLTCPYKDQQYVPNVYTLPEWKYGKNEKYICQMYAREQLERWSQNFQAEIVDQQYWEIWNSEYWGGGDCLIPPRQVERDANHHLTCLLIRKRG